ncbi:hypothetical protein MGYG_05591 [Nannizzia gypsea CBS 118893]|uniref:Dickkopf N-terminal cysteine-rich domain-containing protein n=1 Tax=Arthroderma gypseum (strain ATCC MYA-4604 / CBS 118893) TaxID=535722 RepID=E4UWQ1_ARTGP|nr:hypothetical protein MGYG_05591 [Nannizzia gypsea CBS 118893]EFR02594.1 hypothetical protein MGYG_05591 [Nannizzia gypsea CBS 118893]
MAMAKVGSSCGGWVKDVDGEKFLGQCGPEEHCLDRICRAKVRRGGDCSEENICFSTDYCDEKNVCRKRKETTGPCASDGECKDNVCVKGRCKAKGQACGSDADCKHGKVCLYATNRDISTVKGNIRTCQNSVNGNLGIKCSRNKDCTKCHAGQTLAQLVAEAKEKSPSLAKDVKKNASKLLAEQRRRQRMCTKTTKCQFNVCVEPDWFPRGKAETGFYCRRDADCESGNCETTTHDNGKLTLKYCGGRKTSS